MRRGSAAFAKPAELIGHSARSLMLAALLDGRALPMSMLASEAGIAQSTASEHLAKLADSGLLRVRRRGRRRYFELASADVAEALLALARIAPGDTDDEPRADQRSNTLLLARTCYDHLAGHLGVAVTASLLSGGVLVGDGCGVSERGRRLLNSFGVRLPPSRRQLVAYCGDWSDQRQHLSGALGAALLDRLRELDWVRADDRTARVLVVTDVGSAGFAKAFGVAAENPLGISSD